MNTFTAPLTPDQVKTLRQVLERNGFEFGAKEHALFSARKAKLNVTAYEKGPKVLVQGKDTEDFIRFTLEPEVLKAIGEESQRMGTDKLSSRQIDQVIKATRAERSKRE